MQSNPSSTDSLRFPSGVSVHLAHKRHYAQDTSSRDQGPTSSSSFELLNQPPPKQRKIDHTPKPKLISSRQMDGSRTRHAMNKASLSARISSSGSQPTRGRSKAPKAKQQPRAAVLPEPLRDVEYIDAHYKSKPLKAEWEINPKSPLINLLVNTLKTQKPVFEFSQGLLDGKLMIRSACSISFSLLCVS